MFPAPAPMPAPAEAISRLFVSVDILRTATHPCIVSIYLRHTQLKTMPMEQPTRAPAAMPIIRLWKMKDPLRLPTSAPTPPPIPLIIRFCFSLSLFSAGGSCMQYTSIVLAASCNGWIIVRTTIAGLIKQFHVCSTQRLYLWDVRSDYFFIMSIWNIIDNVKQIASDINVIIRISTTDTLGFQIKIQSTHVAKSEFKIDFTA